MWSITCKVTLGLCLFLAAGAVAQESPEYTIDDFAWLAGHWQGEAFGGVCEEVWSPASAGTMIGTYKQTNGGEVRFYEIMKIAVDSAGPSLTLKHFNADLTGWEEKDDVVTFPFVDADDRRIEFDGLVYELADDYGLVITVTLGHDGDTPKQEVIRCRRVGR